jgi:hypothetical protein
MKRLRAIGCRIGCVLLLGAVLLSSTGRLEAQENATATPTVATTPTPTPTATA